MSPAGRRTRLALAGAVVLALAPEAPAADRTVLAIGAHAGDAEITTGALLARHKRLGDRVVILHLTLGEGGNPKLSPAAYGEQKKREALAAAQALGAEVLFGPWKDGELRDTEEAARFVADVIRQVKPTHVVTHWKASLHPDHEAAHRIVNAAVLLASLEGFVSAHPRHRGAARRLLRRQLGGRRGLRALPVRGRDARTSPPGRRRSPATSSSGAGSRPSPTSSTTRRSPACAAPWRGSDSRWRSRWTRSRRSAFSTRCPEDPGGLDDPTLGPGPARPRRRGRSPSSSAAAAAPAADAPLRVIVFGAHPDDCDLDAGGTAALWAAKGHAGQVRLADERRRRPPVGGRRRAREAPARGGAGGGAPLRHRRVRGARQPRRRARADARRAPAGDPPHPPVERRRGDRPAAERLPPRPPLHRRPRAGHRLHGHGAERLPRHAAAAEEPRLPLLAGPLPAAEPVPARRGRGHRLGDRQEDPRARRPRVAGLRVAALGGGRARHRAEGARGAASPGCGSSGAAGRSARTCGRRCGSGTGRGPRR